MSNRKDSRRFVSLIPYEHLLLLAMAFLSSWNVVACLPQSANVMFTTSPVNITEGDTVTITCQVSGPFNNVSDSLTISRKSNPSNILLASVSGKHSNAPDNVQFKGWFFNEKHGYALVVYIKNINRDEGVEYICEASMGAYDYNISSTTIALDVLFPPSGEPECKTVTSDPSVILNEEGGPILSCTSDAGNPPVTLQWSNTGSVSIPEAKVQTSDNRIVSLISLSSDMSLNEVSLTCSRQSTVFPDSRQSCSIGSKEASTGLDSGLIMIIIIVAASLAVLILLICCLVGVDRSRRCDSLNIWRKKKRRRKRSHGDSMLFGDIVENGKVTKKDIGYDNPVNSLKRSSVDEVNGNIHKHALPAENEIYPAPPEYQEHDPEKNSKNEKLSDTEGEVTCSENLTATDKSESIDLEDADTVDGMPHAPKETESPEMKDTSDGVVNTPHSSAPTDAPPSPPDPQFSYNSMPRTPGNEYADLDLVRRASSKSTTEESVLYAVSDISS